MEGHKRYRLPTEAEWEYAARAGTATAYCFGDHAEQLGDYAWYNGNSGRMTHPEGQKKANPWGLHDMYGNVQEWVQDWYDADIYRQKASKDPHGRTPAYTAAFAADAGITTRNRPGPRQGILMRDPIISSDCA